jgi:hypothetical protein
MADDLSTVKDVEEQDARTERACQCHEDLFGDEPVDTGACRCHEDAEARLLDLDQETFGGSAAAPRPASGGLAVAEAPPATREVVQKPPAAQETPVPQKAPSGWGAALVQGLARVVLVTVGLALLLSALVPVVFAGLVLLLVVASPLLVSLFGVAATASIESPEARTETQK